MRTTARKLSAVRPLTLGKRNMGTVLRQMARDISFARRILARYALGPELELPPALLVLLKMEEGEGEEEPGRQAAGLMLLLNRMDEKEPSVWITKKYQSLFLTWIEYYLSQMGEAGRQGELRLLCREVCNASADKAQARRQELEGRLLGWLKGTAKEGNLLKAGPLAAMKGLDKERLFAEPGKQGLLRARREAVLRISEKAAQAAKGPENYRALWRKSTALAPEEATRWLTAQLELLDAGERETVLGLLGLERTGYRERLRVMSQRSWEKMMGRAAKGLKEMKEGGERRGFSSRERRSLEQVVEGFEAETQLRQFWGLVSLGPGFKEQADRELKRLKAGKTGEAKAAKSQLEQGREAALSWLRGLSGPQWEALAANMRRVYEEYRDGLAERGKKAGERAAGQTGLWEIAAQAGFSAKTEETLRPVKGAIPGSFKANGGSPGREDEVRAVLESRNMPDFFGKRFSENKGEAGDAGSLGDGSAEGLGISEAEFSVERFSAGQYGAEGRLFEEEGRFGEETWPEREGGLLLRADGLARRRQALEGWIGGMEPEQWRYLAEVICKSQGMAGAGRGQGRDDQERILRENGGKPGVSGRAGELELGGDFKPGETSFQSGSLLSKGEENGDRQYEGLSAEELKRELLSFSQDGRQADPDERFLGQEEGFLSPGGQLLEQAALRYRAGLEDEKENTRQGSGENGGQPEGEDRPLLSGMEAAALLLPGNLPDRLTWLEPFARAAEAVGAADRAEMPGDREKAERLFSLKQMLLALIRKETDPKALEALAALGREEKILRDGAMRWLGDGETGDERAAVFRGQIARLAQAEAGRKASDGLETGQSDAAYEEVLLVARKQELTDWISCMEPEQWDMLLDGIRRAEQEKTAGVGPERGWLGRFAAESGLENLDAMTQVERIQEKQALLELIGEQTEAGPLRELIGIAQEQAGLKGTASQWLTPETVLYQGWEKSKRVENERETESKGLEILTALGEKNEIPGQKIAGEFGTRETSVETDSVSGAQTARLMRAESEKKLSDSLELSQIDTEYEKALLITRKQELTDWISCMEPEQWDMLLDGIRRAEQEKTAGVGTEKDWLGWFVTEAELEKLDAMTQVERIQEKQSLLELIGQQTETASLRELIGIAQEQAGLKEAAAQWLTPETVLYQGWEKSKRVENEREPESKGLEILTALGERNEIPGQKITGEFGTKEKSAQKEAVSGIQMARPMRAESENRLPDGSESSQIGTEYEEALLNTRKQELTDWISCMEPEQWDMLLDGIRRAEQEKTAGVGPERGWLGRFAAESGLENLDAMHQVERIQEKQALLELIGEQMEAGPLRELIGIAQEQAGLKEIASQWLTPETVLYQGWEKSKRIENERETESKGLEILTALGEKNEIPGSKANGWFGTKETSAQKEAVSGAQMARPMRAESENRLPDGSELVRTDTEYEKALLITRKQELTDWISCMEPEQWDMLLEGIRRTERKKAGLEPGKSWLGQFAAKAGLDKWEEMPQVERIQEKQSLLELIGQQTGPAPLRELIGIAQEQSGLKDAVSQWLTPETVLYKALKGDIETARSREKDTIREGAERAAKPQKPFPTAGNAEDFPHGSTPMPSPKALVLAKGQKDTGKTDIAQLPSPLPKELPGEGRFQPGPKERALLKDTRQREQAFLGKLLALKGREQADGEEKSRAPESIARQKPSLYTGLSAWLEDFYQAEEENDKGGPDLAWLSEKKKEGTLTGTGQGPEKTAEGSTFKEKSLADETSPLMENTDWEGSSNTRPKDQPPYEIPSREYRTGSKPGADIRPGPKAGTEPHLDLTPQRTGYGQEAAYERETAYQYTLGTHPEPGQESLDPGMLPAPLLSFLEHPPAKDAFSLPTPGQGAGDGQKIPLSGILPENPAHEPYAYAPASLVMARPAPTPAKIQPPEPATADIEQRMETQKKQAGNPPYIVRRQEFTTATAEYEKQIQTIRIQVESQREELEKLQKVQGRLVQMTETGQLTENVMKQLQRQLKLEKLRRGL